MKFLLKLSIPLILIPLMLQTAFAAGGDIAIDPGSISFSENRITEGTAVRIYLKVKNNSGNDLKGTLQAVDTTSGSQIEADQPISILAGKTDDVFMDWVPAKGERNLQFKLSPWDPTDDDTGNNIAYVAVSVLPDNDRDGVPDAEDGDDDNDGVEDTEDAFPRDASEQLDTDGDSVGNNADEDDDNDGTIDEEDDLPLDFDETVDTDGDGIGNNADEDDDGDGLSDEDEVEIGTDPLIADTDEDEHIDGEDDFPLDKDEWQDYDKDGIGNNADEDDDGDGLSDLEDEFPLNLSPIPRIKGPKFIALANKVYTFSSEPSVDPDGEIKQVEWDVSYEKAINNKNFTEKNKEFEIAFDSKEKPRITLKIQDEQGEIVERTIKVLVINPITILVIVLVVLLLIIALIMRSPYKKKI